MGRITQSHDADIRARTAGIISLIIGGAYLVWRAGWTLNMGAAWLSIPLFVGELHGYLSFALFFFMCWEVKPTETGALGRPASVDFFIPTYNEPYEILALTIAGAAAMTYPHTTYVLDDGNRPWVRRLARRFGAVYVNRADRSGAKAGNINHALTVSTGEFIAVVDADFIPAPDYIDELLWHFRDDRVAIVQAPQEFYNTYSFQHGGSTDDHWHEQSMFYRVIQPGKNRWNAPFWSGSPSMVRRTALDEIGGVATETVTEDLHTSLRLHARGWKLIYHDRVVALGLAPDDYDGFILQRLRWAQGAMQVIRREWRGRGLTLAQRLNYIGSTGTYFDAYRKALMLLIVPAIIITDQLPVIAPGWLFLTAWGIQFAASQLALKAVARGHYRTLWTEVFDSMKMFAFINASIALLSWKPMKFKVTPKGQAGERRLHPFLYPFLAIVALYLACLVLGMVRLLPGAPGTANPEAMGAAVAWGAVITVVLLAVTWYGFEHVSRRRVHRVPSQVSARCMVDGRRQPVTFVDVTLLGCSFHAPFPARKGEVLTLRLPNSRDPIKATVRGVHGAQEGGEWLVRASYEPGATPAALAGLIVEALWESWRPGEFAREPIPFPAPPKSAARAA